jgi:hypothetical protein
MRFCKVEATVVDLQRDAVMPHNGGAFFYQSMPHICGRIINALA